MDSLKLTRRRPLGRRPKARPKMAPLVGILRNDLMDAFGSHHIGPFRGPYRCF